MRFILFLLCLLPSVAAARIPMPFQRPNMSTGGNFSSSALPNGVFVLEAYFAACHYCNENAANVDRLASRLKLYPDVLVLDVGVDSSDQQYTAWLSRHPFQSNHLVLKDAARALLRAELSTSSFPTTYVLRCDGELLFKHIGIWSSTTRMQVEQAVVKGLTHKCK